MKLFAGGLGHDFVCGQHRHVAVDTVGGRAVAELAGYFTTLPLMARETSSGVGDCGALDCVNVMAR